MAWLLPAALIFSDVPLIKKSTVVTPTPLAIPKTFAPLVARLALLVSTRNAPENVLLVALRVVAKLPPMVRLAVPVRVAATTIGSLVKVLMSELAIALAVPASVKTWPVLFVTDPPLRIRSLTVIVAALDPLKPISPPVLICSEAPPNVKLPAVAGVRNGLTLTEYAEPEDGATPLDQWPALLKELAPDESPVVRVTTGSWATAGRGGTNTIDAAKTKTTARRLANRGQPLLRGTDEEPKRGEDLTESRLIIEKPFVKSCLVLRRGIRRANGRCR
jgi:hypothetical protein